MSSLQAPGVLGCAGAMTRGTFKNRTCSPDKASGQGTWPPCFLQGHPPSYQGHGASWTGHWASLGLGVSW